MNAYTKADLLQHVRSMKLTRLELMELLTRYRSEGHDAQLRLVPIIEQVLAETEE